MQLSYVSSQTIHANYDFYGLSQGTTSIACSVDPVNHYNWEFAGKVKG